MSDKPTVIEALLAVMEDVQAVGKGERNTQQNYNFRGIDAVVNAVGPAFRKHCVLAIPHKSAANYRDVLTSTGKPSRECTVTVTYRFYGPAGDFIEAEVPGESMDFGDKGTPKAMSVAYRILLLQALCIPTDEADPDATSYERSAPAGRHAPAEPTTDPEWLTRTEAAIGAASNAQQLSQVFQQIATEVSAGKVSVVHREHLGYLYKQREGEIQGSVAA